MAMILSRLPILCALLLCIAVAGGIYWQVIPLFQTNNSTQTIANTGVNLPAKAAIKKDYNIASFKLFGDADLKQAPITTEQKKLPKTRLKLTLTGVLVNPSSQSAGALIVGPDKQTQHYKINDKLPGGATLKQVFPDRVVVNRNGRLENLYFTEIASTGIERVSTYEEPEDTVKPVQPHPQATQNNRANGLSSARNQSIKDRLSKLKKRLLKNK